MRTLTVRKSPHHQPFTVEGGETDEGVLLVPDRDTEDLDLCSAKVWTLHMRAPDDVVLHSMARTLDSMAEAGVIRGYTGGDSFAEWAEPYNSRSEYHAGKGLAMHVWFEAPNLMHAQHRAVDVAYVFDVCVAEDATLSIAQDWAIQAEVFPVSSWRTPPTF